MRQAAAALARREWGSVREKLAAITPAAAAVKERLARAGCAHRLADIDVTRERFLWAVLNCAQVRERFTSIGLGWLTGVLPGAADDIVDEHLLD
jgi:hypothetical protein